VGPEMPAATLVPGAWRELWARGCAGHDGSRVMAGAMDSRLPGDHVGSRGMAGVLCPVLPGSHVCTRGLAGAVGQGLRDGNVGSQGMAGYVVPGLLPAMLVPGAWRELWARGSGVAIFIPGA